MSQPEEVTFARLRAVVTICEETGISEKLRELRLAGQRMVYPYVQKLHDGFIRMDVIMTIVEAKLGFMCTAKSKKDVERILSPPKIHYDGRGVWAEPEFYVPAEEMLIWSETSFIAPLNDAGYRRYMKLFRDFFGDEVCDEMGIPKVE